MLKIVEDYPLKSLNTFGIEANAKYFTEIASADDTLEYFNDKKLAALPLFILGGGSNILLTKNFEGAVMKINISGKTIIKEDENYSFDRHAACVGCIQEKKDYSEKKVGPCYLCEWCDRKAKRGDLKKAA